MSDPIPSFNIDKWNKRCNAEGLDGVQAGNVRGQWKIIRWALELLIGVGNGTFGKKDEPDINTPIKQYKWDFNKKKYDVIIKQMLKWLETEVSVLVLAPMINMLGTLANSSKDDTWKKHWNKLVEIISNRFWMDNRKGIDTSCLNLLRIWAVVKLFKYISIYLLYIGDILF